jgi:hypothetical protein
MFRGVCRSINTFCHAPQESSGAPFIDHAQPPRGIHGAIVRMGITTQLPLHIVRENLTSPKATTIGTELLRRTVNQENSWGKLVRDLAGKVGGLGSLESLHDEPLPDEPFADCDVAEVDRPFAVAVISLFEEQCDRWLDVEYRTIGRRLFARALLNSPTLIRKSSSPVRFAAGRRKDWSRQRGSSVCTGMMVTTTGAIAPTIAFALRRPTPSLDDQGASAGRARSCGRGRRAA